MYKSKKVLFLCTDNFTRSVTAELCLKDLLKRKSITSIEVASAGIKAYSDTSKYLITHFERMKEKGVDTSYFSRTQFNNDYFISYDLIIGMGQEHKDFVQKEYNKVIPLFDEILEDENYNKSVNKCPEDVIDFSIQLKQMVDYFYEVMPKFVEKLLKI